MRGTVGWTRRRRGWKAAATDARGCDSSASAEMRSISATGTVARSGGEEAEADLALGVVDVEVDEDDALPGAEGWAAGYDG